MPLYLNPIPALFFVVFCAYVVWQWVKWIKSREEGHSFGKSDPWVSGMRLHQ